MPSFFISVLSSVNHTCFLSSFGITTGNSHLEVFVEIYDPKK